MIVRCQIPRFLNNQALSQHSLSKAVAIEGGIEQTASVNIWPISSTEQSITDPSIIEKPIIEPFTTEESITQHIIKKHAINRQTNADLIQYTITLIASLTRCNADWQRLDSWYLMKKVEQEKRKE
ncbi:hypothetical protein [uncultured Shewanella sp.]|uniref:hypothetical protein n=1 Tax=uncultured Shewanella sp. TaxID=173975 RepID=UPI002603A5B9|nr:hypothetical protein [uncultured Shewanella sp.]